MSSNDRKSCCTERWEVYVAGGTRAIQPKRYRKRCEQQIGMSIQENFAPLLRDCAQLMAAGENTDKRTVRSGITLRWIHRPVVE